MSIDAAPELVLGALERAGCNPRTSGKGYAARCPAHDDKRASLMLHTGDDGRALLHCHAGCTVDQIVAALGLTMADLFARRNGGRGTEAYKGSPIIAVYDYTNEAGKVLFQVCRTASKEFPFRRPDGNGGWIWNMKDVRRVLYRLPDVIACVRDDGTVYLCEGEKDCNAINALPDAGNIIATTNPGGATIKWRPEYSETLRGAAVVIVQDKDDAGRKHACEVAESLRGFASSVRIVEAFKGKDAADHLAAGFGLADFLDVAEPATTTDAPQDDPRILVALNIIDALTRKLEPPDYALDPLLVRGDKVLLAGEPKLGKSWCAVDLAVALSTAQPFLGLDVHGGPYRVVYLDEENSERLVRYRLSKLATGRALPPEAFANFRYLRGNGLNLTEPADIHALHRDADAFRPDFIIFDSLIRFHRADENDNGSMSGFYADVLAPLAQKHMAGLILIHHLAKPNRENAGELVHRIRGASDLIAQVDEVWTLERAEDALILKHERSRWAGDGAAFHVHIWDTDNGEGVRIIGTQPEANLRDVIYTAVRNTESAGMLRPSVLKLLEEEGVKPEHTDRQATRYLGQLFAQGRLMKRTGRPATYWASDFAPPDAAGITDRTRTP